MCPSHFIDFNLWLGSAMVYSATGYQRDHCQYKETSNYGWSHCIAHSVDGMLPCCPAPRGMCSGIPASEQGQKIELESILKYVYKGCLWSLPIAIMSGQPCSKPHVSGRLSLNILKPTCVSCNDLPKFIFHNPHISY